MIGTVCPKSENDMETEVHDIVQLDPEKTTNKTFAGRFMVVTEIKEWGVVGYIQPLEAGAGGAYYRAETGTFKGTGGKAVWVLE